MKTKLTLNKSILHVLNTEKVKGGFSCIATCNGPGCGRSEYKCPPLRQ